MGSRTRVSFYSAEGSLFGVPEYARVLEGVAERRRIETKFRHNLVAAAVRGQAPVVAQNLLALRRGEEPTACYDGYTCCPVITGYNSAVMAEFNYEKKPISSFYLNPTQERYSMWLAKRYLLP